MLLNTICALRKKSVPVLPGSTVKYIYTLGTMENSQTGRAPTETDKNGAVFKVRILLELGIL